MGFIKVILADDHQDNVKLLHHFLVHLSDIEIVGHCYNGDDLVEQVMQKKPDLLLVDINMPKKNGIIAVKECLNLFPQIKFIFTTGFDEYALEAFQLTAIDYIVKPIEKFRLYKAIEKAKNIILYERNQSYTIQIKNLPIKDQNGTSYVPQHDIYFIEKSGKKCLVYTKERVFETNENISNLLASLDESFFSAHRSYIINLKRISHIVPQNETFLVYFQDFDQQASISKLKINEVKEKMSYFLSD
jgi:two-component system, LytTR family, response regulator